MQRVYDNGHVYKGMYEGWYCPRCADFKTDAEIGPDNTCPIHRIPLDREQRGELVLPALDLPGAARAALRRAAGLRAAARSASTRRARSSPAGCRTSRSSRAKLNWGVPVPWDPDARLLRLVRRAAQLLHGALLRPRRRGPDRHVLARRLPRHRQGHPQVPRGLLAGDAARRRDRAARAPLHPRLPADEGRVGRGAQDVQVAGQRARPVRGHGPVRHRRAALLLLPRGLLRAGRRGLDGRRSPSATRPSSPTSTATSPAARST